MSNTSSCSCVNNKSLYQKSIQNDSNKVDNFHYEDNNFIFSHLIFDNSSFFDFLFDTNIINSIEFEEVDNSSSSFSSSSLSTSSSSLLFPFSSSSSLFVPISIVKDFLIQNEQNEEGEEKDRKCNYTYNVLPFCPFDCSASVDFIVPFTECLSFDYNNHMDEISLNEDKTIIVINSIIYYIENTINLKINSIKYDSFSFENLGSLLIWLIRLVRYYCVHNKNKKSLSLKLFNVSSSFVNNLLNIYVEHSTVPNPSLIHTTSEQRILQTLSYLTCISYRNCVTIEDCVKNNTYHYDDVRGGYYYSFIAKFVNNNGLFLLKLKYNSNESYFLPEKSSELLSWLSFLIPLTIADNSLINEMNNYSGFIECIHGMISLFRFYSEELQRLVLLFLQLVSKFSDYLAYCLIYCLFYNEGNFTVDEELTCILLTNIFFPLYHSLIDICSSFASYFWKEEIGFANYSLSFLKCTFDAYLDGRKRLKRDSCNRPILNNRLRTLCDFFIFLPIDEDLFNEYSEKNKDKCNKDNKEDRNERFTNNGYLMLNERTNDDLERAMSNFLSLFDKYCAHKEGADKELGNPRAVLLFDAVECIIERYVEVKIAEYEDNIKKLLKLENIVYLRSNNNNGSCCISVYPSLIYSTPCLNMYKLSNKYSSNESPFMFNIKDFKNKIKNISVNNLKKLFHTLITLTTNKSPLIIRASSF